MAEKWIIGVDLGGTFSKIAIIDMDGNIIRKWEIPTEISNGGQEIPGLIAKSIKVQLKQWNHPQNLIQGIGIGAPGPVQIEKGIVREAINLGWKDPFPLKAMLEQHTSLPVTVDNDANCAALGEMWKGAGEGLKDLVCVTLGTGVGGGIITNGEIVHGSNGSAGEIGHVTSMLDGGARCNCGKYGCLETIASATGIVRIALSKMDQVQPMSRLFTYYRHTNQLSAKDVFDFARLGDVLALEVVREVTMYLGVALANIANTLNPEAIVLGGGVSKAGDILLLTVKQFFDQFTFPQVKKSTQLRLASLGNDAGVVGAAWLVKKELV